MVRVNVSLMLMSRRRSAVCRDRQAVKGAARAAAGARSEEGQHGDTGAGERAGGAGDPVQWTAKRGKKLKQAAKPTRGKSQLAQWKVSPVARVPHCLCVRPVLLLK